MENTRKNMKIKKIIFFAALSIIFILIALSIWFVSRIQVFGDIQVSYKSDLNYEQVKIIAFTPTGREVIFNFDENVAKMEGFYNTASVNIPSGIGVSEIIIEKDGEKKIFQIYTANVKDDLKFSISNVSFKNSSFLDKAFSFTKWIFSQSVFYEILLFIILSILLLIGFLFYVKQKRLNRLEGLKEKNSFIKVVFVFISSLFFWLILILVLFEFLLRLFGLFFSDENIVFYQNEKEDKLTILCIGDSFTYGIGATSDKSYPKQLKSIIEKNDGIDANVINAGVCAGNTTQMLENVQNLLLKHHPDVVVMLFGMANSWNYYGYSVNDSFLYRIRIYKLFKRIIQNIDYKKNGFEMWQKVDQFSNEIRFTVLNHFIQKKPPFDVAYYSGRYFLSKRNWNTALHNFAYAASLNSMNDSILGGLNFCINNINDDHFYSGKGRGLINEIVVDKTVKTIDSLILKYPQTPDFLFLKYRYYIDKKDKKGALSILQNYSIKFSISECMFFDLEKIMDDKELSHYYKDEIEASFSFLNGKAFYYLKRNSTIKAKVCFNKALKLKPNNYFSLLGLAIIESIEIRKPSPFLALKNDFFAEICKDIYHIIYHDDTLKNDSTFKGKVEKFLSFGLLRPENSDIGLGDSLFLSNCCRVITEFHSLKEYQHEDFELIHENKRTLNIKEKEIFTWIEQDINTIIDICTKQGYPVICMNYPLIPPPNSEEISFWAANVGKIWEKTASSKKIPFINNDSIFSTYKDHKSELFEPVLSGSEHCNELGYKLMAENVYRYLVLNNIIKTKDKK